MDGKLNKVKECLLSFESNQSESFASYDLDYFDKSLQKEDWTSFARDVFAFVKGEADITTGFSLCVTLETLGDNEICPPRIEKSTYEDVNTPPTLFLFKYSPFQFVQELYGHVSKVSIETEIPCSSAYYQQIEEDGMVYRALYFVIIT